MAVVYFDASAFVKLANDEWGSDLVADLWNQQDAAVASPLTYAETRAALAASHHNRLLSAAQLARAVATIDDYWRDVRPIALTPAVTRTAGHIAQSHSLRGADAIHLASALEVSDADVVVAVWDRRLHAAALAEGLPVAPGSI